MFAAGVICFVVAGFIYRTYHNMLRGVTSSGFPDPAIEANPFISTVLHNYEFFLNFFIFCGIISIVSGLFLALKKLNNHEQENH
jgi:CDP-diglyceride synthetase